MPEFSLPALTWTSVLDIVVVAFLIYQVLMFIRGTRAMQMALGLSLVVAFFYFARWAQLETASRLLGYVWPYFVFAVIVIFQSEIRRGLAHFGRLPLMTRFSTINRNEAFDEIVLAVTTLASHRTGALIVIERDIGLKTYIESGIAIDAALSYDLLVTVFNPAVPLHDGAVIVQNGRIAAAACFLPLTVKPRLSKELGTRHRAAIGVTEEADAVAIIVSEETGAISFAHDGEIERFLDPETLRLRVRDVFERKSASIPRVEAEPAEDSYEMHFLKEFFTRNWIAKVFSIGLAAALWVTTAGDRSAESVSKVVRVTPNVVGKPAPGHEIKQVLVSPDMVEISGPEDELSILDSLPTEPVSIEGAYRDVETSVGIQIARPLVRMRHPATAHVRVVILP